MNDTIHPHKPRFVILLGPTGVGKSSLAMELAESLGGEILNADSMQVYRYMDIGTAKPTQEERERVKHHLIDLVDPDEPFHAGLYRVVGRERIESLNRQDIPLLVVGGTGLYIKALTQGLFTSPKIPPLIRERLKQEADHKGKEYLYQRLREIDPETASQIHPNDLFRTVRALEVFEATGVPISFFRNQHRFGDRPYQTLKIGLEMDREHLYRRIEERVDQMLEKGFLREVEGLLDMGYGPELKPMQSLGYKHMVQFLFKELCWDEAVRRMKRDTRQYAKRQWTWFKADREVIWRDRLRESRKVFKDVTAYLQRSFNRSLRGG